MTGARLRDEQVAEDLMYFNAEGHYVDRKGYLLDVSIRLIDRGLLVSTGLLRYSLTPEGLALKKAFYEIDLERDRRRDLVKQRLLAMPLPHVVKRNKRRAARVA